MRGAPGEWSRSHPPLWVPQAASRRAESRAHGLRGEAPIDQQDLWTRRAGMGRSVHNAAGPLSGSRMARLRCSALGRVASRWGAVQRSSNGRSFVGPNDQPEEHTPDDGCPRKSDIGGWIWALVPCTHKNPDAEEDSCPIVISEIVNDWLLSLPKKRSQPIANPSEVTTGHEGPVHCSLIIQIEKSYRMFHNVRRPYPAPTFPQMTIRHGWPKYMILSAFFDFFL